jgi:hypothetical protein|tara:strand:- start:905 stop:1144 length:240 start_codon:yes stop_codon:yes gene_type:complete
MQWKIEFHTSHRRELGDYEYTFTIDNVDSFKEALEKARQQLPIGEKDNTYSRLGVEWELYEAKIIDFDDNFVTFTNDKE